MEKKIFTYIVLALFSWAIIGTVMAGYYFVQQDIYQREYGNLINQIDTSFGDVSNILEGIRSKYDNLDTQIEYDIGDVSTILEGISLTADILITYGNGTKIWRNSTVLPLGATAFTAIYFVAREINYTDYGGDFGILVTSVDGLTSNSTHGWLYWTWNLGTSTWTLPNYSCAKHILHRGDVLAFTYANYMEWPPQPPA